MYVKRVKIKNYRSFGDPAFEMELKPFTLVLGENNVGKTNLLNALGLIFGRDISVLRRRVLELDDFYYPSIRHFREQVADPCTSPQKVVFPEVRIDVNMVDMTTDQEAVVGDWFCNKDLTEAQITYCFAPRPSFNKLDWIREERERLSALDTATPPASSVSFPLGKYDYTIYGGNEPTNVCEPYFLRMLRSELLDALRDAQRELVANSEHRLLYRVLSRQEESGYDQIRELLGQLQSAVKSNPSLARVKREIEALLALVSLRTSEADAAENGVEFGFSSPDTHDMLKRMELFYGADPISIDRNGLGRNNLLYISLILSHLTARESDGTDACFRLIAVEEPEAHLHPHLEDHLAKNIESIRKNRDKNMQLIVTSHSTHIAARLSLENTVVMYRQSDIKRVSSHYILGNLDRDKDRRSISYLQRFIDATKCRMFFSRKIILVEGFAEQILIPRFFERHCHTTLEQVGCNIINVQGVAFEHFLKIVQSGYFVRCAVLTDSDQSKATASRAEKLKQNYESDLVRVYISNCDTFEKDLIASNVSGPGIETLIRAVERMNATRAQELCGQCAPYAIDIDQFFHAISNSKPEFAFALSSVLEEDSSRPIVIPEYIRSALDFLG